MFNFEDLQAGDVEKLAEQIYEPDADTLALSGHPNTLAGLQERVAQSQIGGGFAGAMRGEMAYAMYGKPAAIYGAIDTQSTDADGKRIAIIWFARTMSLGLRVAWSETVARQATFQAGKQFQLLRVYVDPKNWRMRKTLKAVGYTQTGEAAHGENGAKHQVYEIEMALRTG